MACPAPDSPRRIRGRLLALITAGWVGLAAFAAAPVQPAKPALPPQPPKASAPRPRPEVARLRTLVEDGERNAQEKDWDSAGTRAEEAEVLVADWPEEALESPEVKALLDRLQDLESHLPDSESAPATPDPGLKEATEVVPLSGEALKAELEQVKGSTAGAQYDFPIDLNDKVLAWVHEFTTSKRGFMERTLSRATMWLPMARQIFAEERIPQDLAYLAVIESGFINSARSYAQAVGMWQFIRSTGRIYGLNGNAWVEERRDPVKATRASARYLRRLYETSGDWYLALVGYNAGPLTTDRAAQNIGSRNFWDMARSRWLRNQTKNYVPELCAAILIGHDPERYGFKVEQLQPYAYETVEVDRMTSLAVLARYAGTDVDSLKELNPELLRASTPPGRYTLRVPPGLSGATARALARIPANQRLDFQSYKIRKGDTLAKLAAKFKLSPEDLLEANDLKKGQFRAGKVIKVPPPPPAPIDNRDLLNPVERSKVIEDHPLEALPTIPAPVPEPAPQPAPEADLPPVPQAVKAPAPKPALETRPRTHLVKKGETLFAIATRYGLEVDHLRKWNKIKGNRIQSGQRLRLGP
ncbi:LysM peptidoglycan-binding domain-containing protein [Mesoterricola silvestris]|uniref:Lytic transglycosylase n=1 Tax=Mesoterricola silvestris TaxID=2927979 RepID=A0AA48GXN8_9BACT|nr:LysM peptidoglycan-binding domain-containing protein [Mesoterricola silvestris]BDU72253.1 lytic transglycosylase [Mesoterricola silvestris]